MRWKFKALIQRTVARLPSASSYPAYYWLQRTFGRLRTLDPSYGFFVGVEAWKRLRKLGREPAGKTFLEVGTGRAPIVPLSFYLMGARRTTTIDVNPYLRPELVAAALRQLVGHTDKTRSLFGSFLDEERWSRVVRVNTDDHFDVAAFLRLCDINYIAPGDAARTGLDTASVDYHTSNTTLEHIPPEMLPDILKEGDRLLRPDGLFIHRIDYSDHFSHSDRRISPINFLRYSEKQWNGYANNRYMYMNRLRHDDLLEIFGKGGRPVLSSEPDVDEAVLEALRSGEFQVHERFAAKSPETLATTGAWIIARKRPHD
jgi:SAM-dependent methyltransferase